MLGIIVIKMLYCILNKIYVFVLWNMVIFFNKDKKKVVWYSDKLYIYFNIGYKLDSI